MKSMLAVPVLGPLVFAAGVVFSLIMLINCLKRKPAEFLNPLTKDGEHDKLIWAGAIVASFWFFFVGAIVYLFVVKIAKAEKSETEE
jgi:amino acid permease